MGKSAVVFRADGHAKMGLGHLIRSAALAEMLTPDFDCHLVYRHCPKALLADFSHFIGFCQLDASLSLHTDAQALIDYVASLGQPCPIVVLDGYHFTTDYQQEIVTAGCFLVCIDDIHQTEFIGQLVINHAPAATLADYQSAQTTQFALGLRFALLRAPFRQAAQSRTERQQQGNHIFVCLGGADPDNVTIKVLQTLTDRGVSETIDLVVGSAYTHEVTLADYLRHSKLSVTVHRAVSASQMAQLMRASSVGITSPSTVCLEYLSAGGRLFLQQIADNQKEIHTALLARGLAQDISAFSVGSGRGDTLADSPSTRGPMLLDGLQDVRFRKLFAGLGLTYRAATHSDSAVYLQWANDPLVRAQSFDSRMIDPAAHDAWFSRRLEDPNTDLLVFTDRRRLAVGQVRLQLDGSTAVIGYSVAAAARGAGFGLAMLHFAQNHLQAHRPEVDHIVGYVKQSNVASLITFRRLGYRELPTDDYPNAIKFELHDF
ncbi:hypothetical protein LEM8419_00264 [Neolewinella maritima]|uniref:N-acetyltransferase domain-containing protein n=1 Tax=Neolewinella maritima TaxID=1383882 RepID=A0ABM9AWZ8_9BACT|nr:UDP-2,4-diacetamido-2,4,6-trideoxy-beta-L-altropyranose hydrolase [Neolewinella maritima]CAH0998969.1 hypothetical protein LEM8419_00264 [Neolewinella maritima]